MAKLKLEGLEKRFGRVAAVSDVSIDIEEGELVCLLGPSGSGKSTVLRMIGGFETPTAGRILIDGEDVSRLPPERRPTAMVFQSHALWSHMTVFGNIAFGLRLRRLPRAEIRRKVDSVLDLVGLNGFGNRLPAQLSGGQQQRVALARSLVLEPKILLLDEPFASLDQHLRERLREEVRDIQRRLQITTVFVTHGQDEALALADRIVVMRDGLVEQAGRPGEIYASPATPFVAGFIGAMNMLRAAVQDGFVVSGSVRLPGPAGSGAATLSIRPEDIRLGRGFPCIVRRVVDFGTHRQIDVGADDTATLRIHAPKTEAALEGDRVLVEVLRYTIFTDGKAPIRFEEPSAIAGAA